MVVVERSYEGFLVILSLDFILRVSRILKERKDVVRVSYRKIILIALWKLEV